MMIRWDAPEGNAFAIMGIVRGYLKQTGASKQDMDDARARMMAGDYRHLCAVAEEVTHGALKVIQPEDCEDEDGE
jgi:hypothetical protein